MPGVSEAVAAKAALEGEDETVRVADHINNSVSEVRRPEIRMGAWLNDNQDRSFSGSTMSSALRWESRYRERKEGRRGSAAS